MAYNIKKDWDFVILITGDRMVRVGKSIMAQVVCAYLALCLSKIGSKKGNKHGPTVPLNKEAYSINNIYFDNKIMIDEAQNKSQYSVLHYDEGREGLAASKAMKQVQQDLIDFFSECGQLNHIFVIVAPDFFELKEDIAVGRSEVLINVYRKSEQKEMDIYREGVKRPITKFHRGYFQFFSRNKKGKLYDMYRTTHRKVYRLVKADFIGRFTNQYTVDEELYKEKKAQALKRFKERHEINTLPPACRADVLRDVIINRMRKEGKKARAISEFLEKEYGYQLSDHHINVLFRKWGPIFKENEG